jgi:hypothetical protein
MQYSEQEARQIIRDALLGLMATFRVEASEQMLLGYAAGLADLTPSEIKAATMAAIQRSRFMPSVADLREYVGKRLDVDAMAAYAWQDVERAFGFGAYQAVDFEDKAVNATLRAMGGWVAVLDRVGTAEDAKFCRVEFLKLYRAKRAGGFSEEAAAPLRGLGETPRNLRPQRIGMIERRPMIAATRQERITQTAGLIR